MPEPKPPSSQHFQNNLRKKLTPEQYRVTQERGTEMPFTGEHLNNHQNGNYHCVVCDSLLFKSTAKFDSGTGWPSFDEPANLENLEIKEYFSHGLIRQEVLCKNCHAHLGHIFTDGPTKTGLRYCINSCSLNFNKPTKS